MGYPGLAKTLYLTCQAALWFSLAVFMYHCFKKYDSWLTYNEVHSFRQNETEVTEFPDITICSGDPGGLKKDTLLVKLPLRVSYFLSLVGTNRAHIYRNMG